MSPCPDPQCPDPPTCGGCEPPPRCAHCGAPQSELEALCGRCSQLAEDDDARDRGRRGR